jgi:hypothetical protein
MTIEYDDSRYAEIDYAFEVRGYLLIQLQRAKARHYNIKEEFFQNLVDKQDKVIDLLEKT